MSAELTLVNGRITTLSKGNPQVSAIAVKEGRFIAIGSKAEARALAGAGGWSG